MKKTTKEQIDRFLKKMGREAEKKSSKFIEDKKDIIAKELYENRNIIKNTHKNNKP